MGSLFFLSSKSVNSSSHFSFSTPSAAAGRQTKERALSLEAEETQLGAIKSKIDRIKIESSLTKAGTW